MKKLLLFLTMILCSGSFLYAQTTVTLNCDKDNTLYENSTGDKSNGAGNHFFVGRTNQSSNNLRRGLIHFNISSIPSNAIITSCTLTATVNKVKNSTNTLVALHALDKNWGEGSSDANGAEGNGANAVAGDATWTSNFKGTSNWSANGGDFNTTSSATTNIGGTGTYSWSSTDMISDVQNWIDNPNNNFGWILIGDENTARSAKRLTSRENSSTATQLLITYKLPSAITEVEATSMRLFPNPVTTNVTIKTTSLEIEEWVIADVKGRIIQLPFTKENDQYTVNTSTLVEGVYFIRLKTTGGIITKSFVKK